MAFIIAIKANEGETAYLSGGSVFSIYQEDAAKFMKEVMPMLQ